ncbi:MAG: putative metalloprotease CJM1_0395 family protein [Alphaproteobacteria bacterium]
MKKNDAEFRRHEQGHAAAGGQYAGAPQYSYTNVPDGKRYANAGLVSIDVRPAAGDPKATIEKMGVVQRAANPPAEPSARIVPFSPRPPPLSRPHRLN